MDAHELVHGVLRLVGDDGQAHAPPTKSCEQLGYAGVGARVVVAVDGVVRVELGVCLGNRGLVRAGGHGALDESADAVAHEGARLGQRARGHAQRGERVVEREVQVLERVE